MRMIVDLDARADGTYSNTYHHKLRGRIWNALEGTKFESEHDEPTSSGFCFSNPFPWGDFKEGDSRKLLVSATREELLACIAEDLLDTPELNIGEMPFTVTDITQLDPTVGSVGDTGVLETSTGVIAKTPDEYFDNPTDTETYWQPEHTIEPFFDYIQHQQQRKHELFGRDSVTGPAEYSQDLFTDYELIKTFALPVTYTSGVTHTVVCSKWRFDFEVQSQTHREHLDLLLDTGIGSRNSLGFGFVNKRLEGE